MSISAFLCFDGRYPAETQVEREVRPDNEISEGLNQMKSNPNFPNRSARRASAWSNLLLAFLVFGVPLGVKLILQSARAASSEQIKTTESMVVPRAGHA